jgi:hypothetical protein
MLFFAVFITLNIFTVKALATVICPSGCNYLVDDTLLPQFSSYTYYKTNDTNSSAASASASAMSVWNSVTSSMTLSLNTSTTKSLNTTDTYNTIGSLLSADTFANIAGSYTAVAANSRYTDNGRIYYSDIILNGSYSFWTGDYSQTYYDYQGVLTHELGHTWGLKDLYPGFTQLSATNYTNVPTMFGSVSYTTGENVTIFLRDLVDGDKNGILVIKSLCGF